MTKIEDRRALPGWVAKLATIVGIPGICGVIALVIHVRGSAEDALLAQVQRSSDEIQALWRDVSPAQWTDAKFVVYRDRTASRCGIAEATGGPFYCDSDHTVYVDLDFVDAMNERVGDYGSTYVMAHEIGHHLQSLQEWGFTALEAELAADCLAGWILRRRSDADRVKMEQAIGAARLLGDDTMGYAPENWRHGSAARRADVLTAGYFSEEYQACRGRL